ncbi:MAG: DHH family phosphoesterase [Gammaproteobacteria bacterium]|nr:DHH family phosphoesterase [Gammaproteobacteria bacterium]
MTNYDVFNGDADGICALQQLRLHSPRNSVLISGLKRDIDLLSQVQAGAGDNITVLDISLEKNRVALDRVLEAGASVFYADHHYSGDIPQHEGLDAHIDLSADTCTSLIINHYLENAWSKWAVVGAFGDNFDAVAIDLGRSTGLDDSELGKMQQLGICLNYNGYGFELEDLMFHPADLYQILQNFEDPVDFINSDPRYKVLLAQYQSDMHSSENTRPESVSSTGAVYMLPTESWARRIVGVMGNNLAKQNPNLAHALLIDRGDGSYRVSVRAPYSRKQGADDLCRQFASGGGRKAAAGINHLTYNLLAEFVQKFNHAFEIDS